MAFIKTDWKHTKEALHGFQQSLECPVCQKLVREPCNLGGCEHFFCRSCTENADKACPVCQIPSHVKDIQANRELATAVSLSKHLARLLNSSSQDDESDTEDYELDEGISATPLNQVIPIRSSSNTNEAPSSTVFDFSDSPTESPPNPIAGRTRRAQAELKKKQFIKKSNANWNIGQDKQEKCLSCRKPKSKRLRQRVKFERAVETANTVPSDSESVITTSSVEDADRKITPDTNCRTRNDKPSQGIDAKSKENELPSDQKKRRKRNTRTKSDTVPDTNTKRVPTMQSLRADKSGYNLSSGYASLTSGNTTEAPSSPCVTGKNLIMSPSVKLDRTPTPTSKSVGNKAKGEATPAVSGSYKRSSFSPGPHSTPTSSVRSIKRTESPGKSPLLKKNAKGETPLQVAVIKGDFEKAKELLEQGTPPNLKDNAGWTSLHEACNHGFVQIAELLLDYGAHINMPGCDNETPLHDAVINDKVEIVRLLVSRGASVTARNVKGQTALDLATLKSEEMRDALETPLSNTQFVRTAIELPEDLKTHEVALLATGLSREQKRKVDQLALILHTRCLDEFSSSVTHLVAATNSSNLCARTMKYLKCAISGKWIVNFEWVDHCIALKQKVTEEPFAVVSCSPNPEARGPERGRQNSLQQLPCLFDGCSFHLKGSWEGEEDYKHDIMQLIELGGGHILTREPKLDVVGESQIVPYHAALDSKLANCSHYTINNSKDVSAKMIDSRLCEVSSSWIIQCCASFQLIEPL